MSDDLLSKISPKTNKLLNPLLVDLKLPGKTCTLPTKSLRYVVGKEITAEASNGEVYVQPLSGVSEMKLKSADMLFSGKAFDEVIRECCPSILSPLDLYAKDVDMIMCYIRLVTYGQYFNIEHTHDCENPKQHNYEVDLELLLQKTKYLDSNTMLEQFTTTLENAQHVTFEPLRMSSMIEILQMAATSEKEQKEVAYSTMEKLMLDNLCNSINSVADISDKKMIREWLRMIPKTYTKKLTKGIENMNNTFGIDFNSKLQCKDCGTTYDVEIPLNPIVFFSE